MKVKRLRKYGKTTDSKKPESRTNYILTFVGMFSTLNQLILKIQMNNLPQSG